MIPFLKRSLLVVFGMAMSFNASAQTEEMDLSGTWGFQADFMDFRTKVASLDYRYLHRLQDKIELPGITDDYQIGWKCPYRHIDRLTRKYEYMGPAWYQREIDIPKEWKGKQIFLYFERTHWLSSVYICKADLTYFGGEAASQKDYISVPHNHDITKHVKPGEKHLLTVCVDNRFQYQTHKWNHAHTEFTQINWNGILGDIKLVAVDPVYVDDMQVYPDVTNKQVTVKMKIKNHTKKVIGGQAVFNIAGENYELTKAIPVSGKEEEIEFESIIPLGKDIRLWDEFHPNLYKITCSLETKDDKDSYRHEREVTFGMREVAQGKHHVLVNGNPIHLRGTVDNAVFPKTGYCPVDDASWERMLGILKQHGMNHVRFHSWCPTKAAFRAADKLGVYFEVEMPLWGADCERKDDWEKRFDFFRREIKAILKEYGNHPSFILYCNGNEISGDFDFVEELTATGRAMDSRHLYSGSTARKRVKSDQFYTTHATDKGSATTYSGKPYTDWDIRKGTEIDVPVLSHEVGQRCAYPNFKEIELYKDCPVEARNFEIFRDQLEENGMLDLADDFFRVSSKQTAIEYKDCIEAQLRTSTSGGFQLLSITDLPEQGYSCVGILDPFWNSKGAVTPDEFRKFCAPTVALLRFGKRTFVPGETFTGKAEVYNYSDKSLKGAKVKWTVTDDTGKVVKSGSLKGNTLGNHGVFPVGEFSFQMSETDSPKHLTVSLRVGKEVANDWSLWLYPKQENLMQSSDEVYYASEWNDSVRTYLKAGKKVVYIPPFNKVGGRKGDFHNHFWNPLMFKWDPMTLGCLIHKDHPALKEFVTDSNLDWQWWDIINYCRVMEMQDTPRELRPFIQTIDSYDSNKKLGIAFEAKMNGGKLLVLTMDTKKDWEKRIAAHQLLKSIDNYVKSDAFNPTVELDESFMETILKKNNKKSNKTK